MSNSTVSSALMAQKHHSSAPRANETANHDCPVKYFIVMRGQKLIYYFASVSYLWIK